MKIKKGDKVKIISGKDKGKVGNVLKVLLAENKVLVQGVHIVKKHVKPNKVSKEGGIVNMEKPIDVSNVMYFNEKLDKPVHLGYKLIDGKKYRISKESEEVLEK